MVRDDIKYYIVYRIVVYMSGRDLGYSDVSKDSGEKKVRDKRDFRVGHLKSII